MAKVAISINYRGARARKRPVSSEYGLFREAFREADAGGPIAAARLWGDVKAAVREQGYDPSRISVQVLSGGKAEIHAPGARGHNKVLLVTFRTGAIKRFGRFAKPRAAKLSQRAIFLKYFSEKPGGSLKDGTQVWQALMEQVKNARIDERTVTVAQGSANSLYLLVPGPRGPKTFSTIVVKP